MNDLDPLNPPPFAVKLHPPPLPPGVRGAYVTRANAVLMAGMVCLYYMTPDEATRILQKHNAPGQDQQNRRLSSAWKKIRAAIQRGAWFPNGEFIAFDRNGRLVNGQHRLKAIAESGVAVPVLVMFGVDPDAMATFDSGKKRTAGDVLHMLMHSHANTLAAAANWVRRYLSDAMMAPWESLPNDLAPDVDDTFPGLTDSVAGYMQKFRGKAMPESLGAALYHLFRERHPAETERFFKAVARGIDVREGSHEDLLRRRLTGDLAAARQTQEVGGIAALTILAFNRSLANAPAKAALIWKSKVSRFPAID